MRRLVWLCAGLWLTACGAMEEDTQQVSEALLPQTLLLPFTRDALVGHNAWHRGNYHGRTNQPFPPYCPLGSTSPYYYCIYDMQAYGYTDTDDHDHLWIANVPSWGTDEAVANDAYMTWYTASLSTQISPAQFSQITAIDYIDIRITGSVTAPPQGTTESIQPWMNRNSTYLEVGDPQYITNDGLAHQVTWRFTTIPGTAGLPFNKSSIPSEWGFANGNYIGVNRHGGLFVHSMQVYVTYH